MIQFQRTVPLGSLVWSFFGVGLAVMVTVLMGRGAKPVQADAHSYVPNTWVFFVGVFTASKFYGSLSEYARRAGTQVSDERELYDRSV